MTLSEIILDVQRAVGVEEDGHPGPETWAAIRARIIPGPQPNLATPLGRDRVDARSETAIATLHLRVQPSARALVARAGEKGIQIKIISGSRTYAEQSALYAQGRTAPGRKVTNARAGYSNHNFGLAFDIGVFQGGKYLGESPLYKAVASIGTDLGLEWGGNWKSIIDEPHFQLRPIWAARQSESAMLAELRRRHAAGIDAFTA